MTNDELCQKDIEHLNMVAWSVVKRTRSRGWHCADDPDASVDGRTLNRLERMGLITGSVRGTTETRVSVQATLTDTGLKIFEKLRAEGRV